MGLRKREKAVIGLSVVSFLAMAGLFYYSLDSLTQSLPKKFSVQPVVTRDEAVGLARDFLAGLGYDPALYAPAGIGYASSTQELLYFIRERGEEESREYVRNEGIPYVFWQVRMESKQHGALEVEVDSQRPRVIGLSVYAPQGPVTELAYNLSETRARQMSEEFLTRQGIEMDLFELGEVHRGKDRQFKLYWFKWERVGSEFSGPAYAVTVEVTGDRISAFRHSLMLPESFEREYTINEILSFLWMLFINLLHGAAFFLFLPIYAIIKRRELNWRVGLWWGAAFFAGMLASGLNQISSESWWEFALMAVIAPVASGIGGVLMVPVAMHLFRRGFGRSIFLERREGHAVAIRICVVYAYVFIGLVVSVGYYELLSELGVLWSSGVGYIEEMVVTSRNILLMPLVLGVLPAVMEEFDRALILTAGKAVFRRTVWGVLLSAFVWGSMHVSPISGVYPQYLVGVEKVIIGILMGYVLVYFGIETAVACHFINNLVAVAGMIYLYGHTDYGLYLLIASMTPLWAAWYYLSRRRCMQPIGG